MPYEIKFNNLPAGICMSHTRDGDRAKIQYAGNATSEDGEQLILYLGFASNCLDLIASNGPCIPPSQVDHLVAIFRKDHTATVYVNELQEILECRPSRKIEVGEPITEDDIVDITASRFDGIQIIDDVGFLIVCSVGWRKGLLFDFGPVTGPCVARDYDVWQALGQIAARLRFQKRFAISNEDWNKLFNDMWFPFAGLSHRSIERLLNHLRAGWDTSELLPNFRSELLQKIDGFIESWKLRREFQNHLRLLERAVERFKSDDFESCVSILYPRIEGILRVNHLLSALPGPRNQNALSSAVTSSSGSNPYSLLLPHRFEEYLKTIYFDNFDEEAGKLNISRNSVSHGVANEGDFNLKSSIIGFLICNQLFYSFPVITK